MAHGRRPRTAALMRFVTFAALAAGCGAHGARPPSAATPDAATPDAATPDAATPSPVLLEGAVQKGPFVAGSSVRVTALDRRLEATGPAFHTATRNDRGEFAVTVPTTSPVALEAVGYYYNEIHGTLSGSPLTLRAFYAPPGPGRQSAHVNLVTHLTAPRVRALVHGGLSFDLAVRRAETELRATMDIARAGAAPGATMNLAGGDTDDNAYLLAVSSVLAQMAATRARSPERVDATLQDLIDRAALDFVQGTLPPQVRAEIAAALRALDVPQIQRRLAERLAQTGSTRPAPDMNRVLDQDRDGIPNAADNCPASPNPDQVDTDNDSRGDACDECPRTACPDRCRAATATRGTTADACYTPCTGDAQCPGRQRCFVTGETDTAGTPIAICAPDCDPRTLRSCPGDLACVRMRFAAHATPASSALPWTWACVPPALHGSLPRGAPCIADDGGNDACGGNLACEASSGAGSPTGTCRRVCDPAAPQACDGHACVPWDLDVDAAHAPLGLCAPEAPPAGGPGEPCIRAPDASLPASCNAGLACTATGCPAPLTACCRPPPTP